MWCKHPEEPVGARWGRRPWPERAGGCAGRRSVRPHLADAARLPARGVPARLKPLKGPLGA